MNKQISKKACKLLQTRDTKLNKKSKRVCLPWAVGKEIDTPHSKKLDEKVIFKPFPASTLFCAVPVEERRKGRVEWLYCVLANEIYDARVRGKELHGF